MFEGQLDKSCLFWDLNYDNFNTEKVVKNFNAKYLDGKSLLIEQAKHALKIWKIQ